MPQPTSGIDIELEQIPQISRKTPIFQSRPITDAPSDFVRAETKRMAPHAELRDVGKDGAYGVYDGERLIGYSNPTTGQSHIVPLIEGLQREGSLGGHAIAGVRRLLAQQARLFGDDLTQVEVTAPVHLMASSFTQRGTRTDPAAVLATVRLRRRLGGLPVYGPGSAVSVSYSRNGIEAFNHRWTAAKAASDYSEAQPQRHVRDRIVEHIGGLARSAALKMHDVTPVYYDDGTGVIQPVYRYRISKPSPDGVTAPGMFVGYIPIGERVGRLPPLTPEVTKFPLEAREPGGVPTQDQILVGRYVVREDNAGWVASANAFWDSLDAGNPFFQTISFKDEQYYWAEPRLFLSEKDSFINAVHLALTEVHGNWGLFSTLRNNADIVRLTDVPAGGYGGSGVGKLAYWILHSCEVLPTAADETTSFDVWWNIFNGLHAAMGYRTEMWINDQVSTAFGTLVAVGAPVVSSWLTTVINDNDYQAGDTYYDDNRSMREPMGRPSAIAVTGHGDDTARMVEPLPKPSSLTEWWYDN